MTRGLIVNRDGTPMQRASVQRAAPVTSYQAADPMSHELAGWHPFLGSADADLLPERVEIVARIRDLVRNNGWASGVVRRELDTVIGSGLRLSCKPDYRALGLSAEWAAEWANQVEGQHRLWADDPGRWCDATRHYTLGGLVGLAYRHYVIDGDALAVLQWRPHAGPYATTVRVVDPDRLSNPHDVMDTDALRAGVEFDEWDAATAYHIRKRHPADWTTARRDDYAWERFPRETPWGRPVTVHFFDKERDEQSRGVGRLTPVLERLKMLDRYDKVELQAAVLNAILAAFIESPFDHEMLGDALEDGKLSGYQDLRAAFHDNRNITMGGVRLPTLFPGEKIGFHTATRPNQAFASFEAQALRNIAAGTGSSYEQISTDWSKTNYSSARAALLEVWKTMVSRRKAFATGFCSPIYVAWLEEAIDAGTVVLPPGAPDFYEARAAYARCNWIGPPRGWVDPVKERQGALLGVAGGLSTLEDESAEQGKDYQETLAQLRIEISEMPPGVLHPAQADFAKVMAGAAAALGADDARQEQQQQQP
ncbi:phage portal protein [Azospirillum doebereinerae]|uniref:phage portal protein n=1 Tax=Azospirillum doebereinerae TaxID=92933 RepID=UPI001EE58F30|nr:phage portal protein [Azospirillum doebereinerae]MCG5240085.1 phage portal protein [Azospirillum doebereinerae]